MRRRAARHLRARRRARLLRPFLRPQRLRALPPDLRAPNVGRLAEALPGGLLDPGFEVLLRRIDQSPIHRGNDVTPFFSGEETFRAMRADIERARFEVLFEAYILKDDETGRSFVEVLAAAARRGVAVRVLADAFGSSGTHAEFWRQMEEKKIEVRLYHPLFPFLWYQPYRDHRKILAVDRRIAFTGGMNVGNEYGSSRRASESGWRDTHARVAGPAAWEMAVVFSEGWHDAGGTPFVIDPLPVSEDVEAGASVMVLDSAPGRGHQETASALAAVLGASRRSIWITNAYFAPRRGALDILGEVAARGVDVRLLLPGKSDVPIVRHAGHGYFDQLLGRGVRIWEYAPAVLHAKSVVADGAVSLVGSSNMDFRSFHFNSECNLVVFDRKTAATLQARFEEDLKDSVEITLPAWRGRRPMHKLGDRAARLLSPVL